MCQLRTYVLVPLPLSGRAIRTTVRELYPGLGASGTLESTDTRSDGQIGRPSRPNRSSHDSLHLLRTQDEGGDKFLTPLWSSQPLLPYLQGES